MKEVLRRRLPARAFAALRRLHYHHPWVRKLAYAPMDAIDRLTGRADPLVPPRSLQIIGDGDYRAIGSQFLQYFIELGGLQPTDHVLEIGCGTGRMALALSGFLTTGAYRGFDIVPDSIAWARKALGRRFPNLRFDHADVRNGLYNPNGRWDADEYRFPCESSQFDFVIATSVFTHMRAEEIANYLSEASRCLNARGTLFATFLLLGDPADGDRRLLEDRYRGACGDARVVDSSIPEAAIAFPDERVRELLSASGLELVEPIWRGSWRGYPGAGTYQDIVIARPTASRS